MELKLKRSHLKSGEVHGITLKRKGPLIFSTINNIEYLVFGQRFEMDKNDYKILKNIFGDEAVYTEKSVLVPRSFFFI